MSLNPMRFQMIANGASGVVPEFALVALARGFVQDLDGEGSTLGHKMPGPRAEVGVQRGGLECRRHHHQLQVGAQGALRLEAADQADVAEEVAFVKFVEDHCADVGTGHGCR